jgi:hypothetical protein
LAEFSFKFRTHRPANRLEWWGPPMARRFPLRLRELAKRAGERWGLKDPSPLEVMEKALGERWMEDHPGLASLITSYQIGGED